MFSGLWRDLVLAARSLARARAFTLVCVVSLGIGMVPVIAVPYASRISRIPPPGVNTEGLVELVTTSVGPRRATAEWSYPDFVDLRDAETGIALFAATGGVSEWSLDGRSKAKQTALNFFVSANYFKAIGVAPVQGTGFDSAPAEPVVMLGYRFWQNQLGAAPDIVGTSLTIDGVARTVVGVLPDAFGGHIGFRNASLFMPLEQHPSLRAGVDAKTNTRFDRGHAWVHLHGRLLPGVSVRQARAAVEGVTAQLAKAYPATNEFTAGIAAAYDPLGVIDRSEVRVFQAVVATFTGMVLLVVSLNVSGMMQVRSAMRERELSIRQALGAGRGRLARYLLSEALVLACAGGAIASVVLFNLPAVISRLTGQSLPPGFQQALRLDFSMAAICFGICVLTSLVFGWLSAIRFSRPAIISSLKDDAGGGGFRVGRVHRFTAALQVAIAVPLLVMSGQSLDRVRATATSHLGFESDLLYAAPLKLDGLTLENASFQMRKLRDTLAQAEGVASVTVADGLPLDFRGRRTRVALEVDANAAPAFVAAHVTRVGDGFLDTMEIPLVLGRGFTVEDRAGAERVAVISKTLADTLAARGDVIGKRLTFGTNEKTQHVVTVVGITADFPTSQMSTTREHLLLPLAQYPGVTWDAVPVSDDFDSAAHVMLIARSAAGEQPKKMTTALENTVRELDPDFLPSSVVTGLWLRQNSTRDFMVQSAISGGAGSVILMLAALGVYGVVGLMVAARTREIAVRAALGASRRRILGMIIFDVVKLTAPGVAVGVVLTVVLNRINSENMGISLSNVEPLAYVAGAAVAVLVAVLASLAPARRAASVQPMVAMRTL